MKKNKFITYLLLLTLFTFSLNAQDLRFENINDKIKIPSAFCQAILQDSKGYIWISTDKGLYRLNGHSTELFTENNGLPDNVVCIGEDLKGKLWFATNTKRIFTFDKDSFCEAPFSPDLKKKLENVETIYKLSFNANNDLYINSTLNTFIVNSKTNKLQQIPFSEPKSWMSYDCDSKSIIPINGRVFNVNNSNERKICDSLAITFHNSDGLNKKYIKLIDGDILEYYVNALTKGDFTFLELGKKLVILKNNTIVQTLKFDRQILNIRIDKNDGLWVGTVHDGLYYYPNFLKPETKKQYLKGANVQDILVDYEHNLWIATLNRGIFRCSSLKLEQYPDTIGLSKPVHFQKGIDSSLYIFTQNGCFARINSERIKFFCLQKYPNESFNLIRKYQKGYLLFGKGGIYTSDNSFENINKTTPNPSYNWLKVVSLEYGHKTPLYGVSGLYLIKIFPDKIENLISSPAKINSYLALDDNHALIGTDEGLFKANLNAKKLLRLIGLNGKVNAIFKSSSGVIIVGTEKEGLLKFDGKTLTRIDNPLILPSPAYNDIDEDSQGKLWCATSQGIYCFVSPENPGEFIKLDETNGLPGNSIFNLSIYKEHLYLSTDNGLFKFSINNATTFTNPKFYIREFKTDKRLYSYFNDKISLSNSENTIYIKPDILTFEAINKPQLQYELSGKIDKTVLLRDSILEIKDLLPGDYQLKIFAVNSKLQKSRDCIKIQFSIDPPFYFKAWFILTIVILLFGLLILINHFNIKRIKRKEEESNRINKLLNESKLTAIQAQMNPHFIFNSINSIQNYILQKKEKDAYNYLAKFSKLIRMVLLNSDKSQIALYEEIDLLKIYIEIEQLRFDNSFDYEINIDDSVNEQEIFIPPMLIQPYIENAIWHGIMHLDGIRKGNLFISFSISEQLLKITVQDNGVGREVSKSYKKDTEHKPVAMKLSQKRLEIISNLFKEKNITIDIQDIYDFNKSVAGTRVELFLPLNLQLMEYD